jgi:mannose-6-phosphate isomerase-like protein (cupin superfamily)
MPWGHRHREQEEVYVVVAGSGRAKLDEDVIEIETWDVVMAYVTGLVQPRGATP